MLIIAAAAPQTGAAAEGRAAGARAYALSNSDIERYEAARLTALAAANEDRLTLATLWLRRALTVAPDDAARAQTIADARFLQDRNPWAFDLMASLVPSSNVNGGAADRVASAPGTPTGTLSDDAQALAGWRAALGFGASYRLQQNATSRTRIGAQYQLARVKITEDVDLPDEALATDIAEFSLRHDRALATGSISGQISYARVNYRNLDPATLDVEVQKYDIWRLNLDRRLPLADRAELTLSASRSLTSYDIVAIGDVQRTAFGTSVDYILINADRLRA